MEGNCNHLHVWDSRTMVVMHLVLNINFAPSASPPSSECSSNTNPMILHYLDDTTTKSVTIHSCGLQRLTDLNLKLYTAARWLYNYDFHHSPPPIPAHKENSKKNSNNLVRKSFLDQFSLQEEAWDEQQVCGEEQSTQEGGEEGQGGEEQVVS